MYRTYELREDRFLVVEVQDKHWYERPNLVIRIDVTTFDFSIRNIYPNSRLLIQDEIKRLFDLLENPHWRSIVNTYTNKRHQLGLPF